MKNKLSILSVIALSTISFNAVGPETAYSANCLRTAIPLNKAIALGPIPISLGLKYFPVDNQSPFVTGMRVRAVIGTTIQTTKYVEGRIGSISNCNIAIQVDRLSGTGALLSARFITAGEIGAVGPTGPAGSTGAVGPTGSQGIQGVQGVPGTNGFNGENGQNGINGLVPAYGSFRDTTTQQVDFVNTPKAMTFNQITPRVNGVVADGVSVSSLSHVTVATTGTYNIQFSAQLAKTDGGNDTMDIWLRVDNIDVPWSNTEVTISSTQRLVASWNFMIFFEAGHYFELMYSSADINTRILAEPALTGPVRPGIPSVILTVQQVN